MVWGSLGIATGLVGAAYLEDPAAPIGACRVAISGRLRAFKAQWRLLGVLGLEGLIEWAHIHPTKHENMRYLLKEKPQRPHDEYARS